MNTEVHRRPGQDRLPKAIGPYAVRARIGRGAMGVVYQAVDERTNTPVALKVMAGDLDGDAETFERFFREAHVAGKLRHRNVVTVLDSGEDGGRLYIAMELLSGGTMAEVCQETNPLDIEDRIDVMIQVCQGLNVAHHAGVFHRDLKPANLFLCDDGRVKILDFGVARLVGSNMTVTGNIIGTPDFMSPEQVRGQEIDSRSDIFSLGSVFYYLLTGRKPFAASDLPTVLHKVVRSQPLPLRDDEAPEAVANVVRKAMSKDPDGRQQSIEALTCELLETAETIEAAAVETARSVRATGEEIQRLAEESRALARALEVPEGPPPDAWRLLAERFPVLASGPRVLGTYPMRTATVKAIEHDAAAELSTLRATVSKWKEGHEQLMAGLALQQSGALEAAAEKLAGARVAVPSSMAIARASESCAVAIDAQRERQALLQTKLTLARDAASRGEWTTVFTITTEIEDIDPQSATAYRLRSDALKNLAAPPGAERPSAARPPRQTTSGTRLRAAAAHPEDDTTNGEHAYAPTEETYLDLPSEERTRTIARLNADALHSFQTGDLVAAEQLAAQSVALDGEDEEGRHLLERIRTELAVQSDKDSRTHDIGELLRRSAALADRKEFDKALKLADDALKLDPSHGEALDLRTRVSSERESHAAEAAAATARVRRARAAAPALSEARRALAAREFDRARWSAESALALDPDSADAPVLLAQIAQAMPQSSGDDTVKLGEPESDTAIMTWREATVAQRFAQLREQAVFWLRRWHTTDKGEGR